MEKYENLKEQGTQIIGYCSDSQEKWGALYGIGYKYMISGQTMEEEL